MQDIVLTVTLYRPVLNQTFLLTFSTTELYARSEAVSSANIMLTAIWDITPCSMLGSYKQLV